MPELGTIVSSITQDRFVPKAVDNILNGNVLTMRLLRNARSWRGGVSLEVPVYLTTASAPGFTAVGSYAGFDNLSVLQENMRQRASFTPSQEYASVPISGIQKAINSGDAAVLNLVSEEINFRAKGLADTMGTQLYGDGTGNTSKDILGLLAAVDDTTNVTTYGGLSRSTYSNWNSTITAQSGAALSLAHLAADVDAAQVANELPTIGICPPAVFTLYEALLTPTVSHQFSMNDFRMTGEGMARVGGALAANQGFRALTFRGIPIVADEKCTAQYLYFLNENHLWFYTIPVKERAVKAGFSWTGFKEGINQDAVVGQLLWYGQLVGDGPRFHSRRTGIST
jgi:hypothetical protein